MLLRVPGVLSSKLHAKGSPESIRGAINAPTKGTRGGCFTHSSYRCVTEHPGWRVYDFRKFKMPLRVPGVQSSKPQAKYAYKGHLGCYPKSPTPNALAKGTQGGEFMISASSRCSCEHPRCYPQSPTPNALTKDTLGAILKAPRQMRLQRAPKVACLCLRHGLVAKEGTQGASFFTFLRVPSIFGCCDKNLASFARSVFSNPCV